MADSPSLFEPLAPPTPGLEGPVQSPDAFQGKEFLPHEFLLWLWFRSERDFGAFELPDGPVDLWYDDRMTFFATQEKKVTSTFSGGAPSTTPEARLSILSGKVMAEARLGMRRGEAEWSFVLRAKGGDLQLHGVKVPAVVKDGGEEAIYERTALLGVVIKAIQTLFGRFFLERSEQIWTQKTVPAMRSWLMGEDEGRVT